VALAWVTQPLLESRIPGLSDAGIAMVGALLLFALPVGYRPLRFSLTWKEAEALPWGVLILFGGGLSLASAIQGTGLAGWIGGRLGVLDTFPLWVLVLAVTVLMIFLTELTSNTATAAAFLPVVAALAVGAGESPLVLAVPAALAASCAFMLPVATPPNAVVFGSGEIEMGQMIRAGLWLNVLLTLLITALALWWVPRVL
jgi:sodium-dependent dicarboxylate transporter 2/3/5